MSRSELSLSDEWETPNELYQYLCEKHNIYPEVDVAASFENKKCECFLSEHENALDVNWRDNYFGIEIIDVWCNPPHSKNEEFVKKAYEQWVENNINIMMILPANALCTNYAEAFILPFAEYHPINRKFCKFLHDGKVKDSSRNGYFVVIWRKI